MKHNIVYHPGRISTLVPDLTVRDLIFLGKTAHLICPVLIHVRKHIESQVCILTEHFFLAGQKNPNFIGLY